MNDNEILNMCFGIIDDPRCEVNVIHPLVDILKLVMIAVLCGMDELDKIIDYGENKKEFDIKLIPSKSTDAIKTIETMMNIVTAYTDTGVELGQITVNNKNNEIPAVRELIELLNIEGMVITADAMHCQKETAEIIIKNQGDYVLQLKAN